MKKSSFLKLLALLLAMMMVLPMLAACGENETETTTPATNDGQNKPGDNTEKPSVSQDRDYFYLGEKGVTDFSLVYSEEALVLTKSEATLMVENIEKITGCDMPIVGDASEYTKHEILIGIVGTMGRPELEEYAESCNLGLDDYAMKVIGDDLVIACGSKESSVKAITLLQKRFFVIDEEERTVKIPKDLDYVLRFEDKNRENGLSLVEVTKKADDALLFTLNPYSEADVPVRLSYTGKGGWRIQTQYSLGAPFSDIGAAQLISASIGDKPYTNKEKLTYFENGDNLVVQAPDKTYAVLNTKTFSIKFCYADGTIARTLTELNHQLVGKTETLSLYADFTLNDTEAIYGSGERFDSVNQRGKKVIVQSGDEADYVYNSYVSVPLFSSSRGSGLFINNNGYMTADIGATDYNKMHVQLSSGNLDCYVYVTNQISQVLSNYADLSGHAEMPAEWAEGLLVCRYNETVDTYEMMVEMIANMESYHLPWTGVIVDGWDIYDFERHEELKRVCDLVHSFGKKVICNVDVGFMPGFDTLPEMFAVSEEDRDAMILDWQFKYYYTEQKNGDWETSTIRTTITENVPIVSMAGDMITPPIFVQAPVTSKVPATCNPFLTKIEGGDRTDVSDDYLYETRTYIDITNPVAVEWFFGLYWDYLLNEVGVDGARVSGGNQIPDVLGELKFYNTDIPSGGARGWYPTYFTSLLIDVLGEKPDSGVCMTRGGGIGSQRNGFIWGGEQSRTVNRLERQVKALVSAGLSGIPFIAYDIGGSFYKNDAMLDIDKEAKIFLRATQFAAFTAAMQTGSGDVRSAFDFAIEDENYAYVTDLYRAYTRLHSLLMPYINEAAEEATKTGMPLARHLVLAYQNDKNVYNIEDEYLLGNAILVAPELYGLESRSVYLPEGEWVNLFTGETTVVGAEGKTIEVSVDLAQIPVFYNKKVSNETLESVLADLQEVIAEIKAIEIK